MNKKSKFNINTWELGLSFLDLDLKNKDSKVVGFLILKRFTTTRLEKLAKKIGTSISDTANKVIRATLHLKN